MKIGIGADPAGFKLKAYMIDLLSPEHEIIDYGCDSLAPADYTEFAAAVAEGLNQGEIERGILICGTGHGMTIAANRHKGVRAVPCYSPLSAIMSREHNDSNILCLGAWLIEKEEVWGILDAWLFGKFSAGEVHKRRIARLDTLE